MPRDDVEIAWRETQGFVSGYKDRHIVGTDIRYGKCTRRGALLAGAPLERCNSTRDCGWEVIDGHASFGDDGYEPPPYHVWCATEREARGLAIARYMRSLTQPPASAAGDV